MEINDKTNLQNLTQSLSFKPLAGMQTSFISELDFSLQSTNVIKDQEVTVDKKPIDVKKEEPIVENKEQKAEKKSENKNTEVEKQEKKVDDKSNKNNSEVKNTQDASVDVSAPDADIDVDTDLLTINSYLEESDVLRADVIETDYAILDVVETEIAEEVNDVLENDVEKTPKTFKVTSEDVIDAAYLEAEIIKQNPENAKSLEKIKSLFVEGSMASDANVAPQEISDAVVVQATQVSIDEESLQTVEAQILESSLETLSEEGLVIKSPEAVKQERELAEKLPVASKLNVEVSVEEEGFDFSKPQIIVKEEGVLEKPKTDVNNFEVKQEVLRGQNVNLDSSKVFASVQNNVVYSGVDVASKSSQNNIAPIGFEVSKSIKNTTANPDIKQTSNDNLRGLSKEVIDQVKVNITKSAVKGVDVIDISLKPEELGKLNIKMEVNKKEGSLDVHIAASTKEAIELMQKDLTSLQKAFEEAGFKLSEESFSFSYNQENQNNNDNNKQARMEFMADALSLDASENQEIIYEGNNALNIKV